MLELNQDLFKEIFKEAFEMARFEHENIMKCQGISLDEKINPEARFFEIRFSSFFNFGNSKKDNFTSDGQRRCSDVYQIARKSGYVQAVHAICDECG